MIKIVPFADADLSGEPFPSLFQLLMYYVWFELTVVPVLVGKDLGKEKGNGCGEEREHWWLKAEVAKGESKGFWVGRRQIA